MEMLSYRFGMSSERRFAFDAGEPRSANEEVGLRK